MGDFQDMKKGCTDQVFSLCNILEKHLAIEVLIILIFFILQQVKSIVINSKKVISNSLGLASELCKLLPQFSFAKGFFSHMSTFRAIAKLNQFMRAHSQSNQFYDTECGPYFQCLLYTILITIKYLIKL